MRKAINENPVVQVVLIGVLVVIVGFLFVTRLSGQGGSEAETPPPTDSAATLPATGAPATDAPATTAPATGAPAPATETALSSDFAASPGLPADVVDAYEGGKVVVLLVVRGDGIDDRKVEAAVRREAGAGESVLFVAKADKIGKYARITQGVDVDRVPAMVVIRPKRLSEGPLPEATVSYGYRGPQSVAQAVRDALYKGPDDIPYYPE